MNSETKNNEPTKCYCHLCSSEFVIKRCPHCGSEVEIKYKATGDTYITMIECKHCKASVTREGKNSFVNATSAWNNRI